MWPMVSLSWSFPVMAAILAAPCHLDYRASRFRKTVLSTSIIDTVREHIRDDSNHILAFYCDKGYDDNLSSTTILASIIAQALAQLVSIPDRISAAFNIAERYCRSKISTADQPVVISKDLVTSLEKAYIIVDGLDELKDSLTFVETLREFVNDTTNVQLILLSRDLPGLSSRLSGLPKISLTPAAMSIDIDNYISVQLLDLPLEDSELRDFVFRKLSQGANGMFLWASLMVQTLKLATSPHEIIERTRDLPIGIDIIYGDILKKLAKETLKRRLIAKRALLWICCSARPLHWNELASALALEHSGAQMVESKKPFKSVVLELYSPLIEYLPEQDLFRPTHSSVREFLLSQSHLAGEAASQFFY
jgi:ankyrin repeat domain-containing protein 50